MNFVLMSSELKHWIICPFVTFLGSCIHTCCSICEFNSNPCPQGNISIAFTVPLQFRGLRIPATCPTFPSPAFFQAAVTLKLPLDSIQIPMLLFGFRSRFPGWSQQPLAVLADFTQDPSGGLILLWRFFCSSEAFLRGKRRRVWRRLACVVGASLLWISEALLWAGTRPRWGEF